MRETDRGSGSPREERSEEGPPSASSLPAVLGPADLERVFRRASDLQFRAGSDAGQTIGEAEALRIGEEVGLERRYVRQALAEVRADALLPVTAKESRLAVRLYGTALIRESRVVPGDRDEVNASISAHFRERELLKPVRIRAGGSLWQPAAGLLSTMKRAMDVGGHGYDLAKARSVEVDVEPLEPGWSLVTLTADVGNLRNEVAAGWYLGLLGLAIPAAIALVAIGGPELPMLIGSGLAGGTAVGTATWATGKHFRRRRERVRLVFQGLLDRLEQGGLPSPDEERSGGGWQDALKERLLG